MCHREHVIRKGFEQVSKLNTKFRKCSLRDLQDKPKYFIGKTPYEYLISRNIK